MNSYYECHVTMIGPPSEIKPVVEKLKWKFSVIDGDPVLGDDVKCYATKLFNNRLTKESVLKDLLETAQKLDDFGCSRWIVTRRKVELVIFDDRSSKVNCEGGCVDCHLDDITTEKNHE